MSKLYKTESNAVLRFYEVPMKNNFTSEQAGKPVFDTVLMCEIITPGQSASCLEVEIERLITNLDGSDDRKVRRSKYYDTYRAQVEAHKTDSGEYADTGMPIRSWAQIDRGTAETLAAQGIYTVDALASISDSALSSIGLGARSLREQAKAYLLSREFGVPTSQMAAENTQIREDYKLALEEIAALKAEVARLALVVPDTAESKTETLDKAPALI